MADKMHITSPDLTQEDLSDAVSLRPRRLAEFIGQKKLKDNLSVYIKAAKQRKESLDHILLEGPPGLGKTTLANIISNEMEVNIRSTSAPAIERAGDLAAILTNIKEFDCFFIDEIHRLHPAVEEVLYSAMEDFSLDMTIGQGPSAKTIKLQIPQFTLLGATTRSGLLTSPLRARFGINLHLDFYSPEELSHIVHRSAKILDIRIDRESCTEIAQRSRGTPRIVNRLLKRIRDFAQVEGTGIIDLGITRSSLERLEVDGHGLDLMDRKFLSLLIDKFDGGPVGIDTISVALGEDRDTIEDVYEPFLIQSGFLKRTSRGRVATRTAYRHFGLKSEGKGQDDLF
jgi:holliday junction DNA helicase RuvB